MCFHFKRPKNFGPRIVKPGAPRAQRSEDMHSRRGSPQTRAGSRILHPQVPPSASPGAAAKAGCPAPSGGSRGPPIPSEIPSLPQATSPRNADPRAQIPHRAPRMQSVSPGLDVDGRLRAPRQRVCVTLDTSLAPRAWFPAPSFTTGRVWSAWFSGQAGWPASRGRTLFNPTWLPVRQVSGLRVTQRGRDEAFSRLCGQLLRAARTQTTGKVHGAAGGPPCRGSLTARWLVAGLKLPGGWMPNAPAPSGWSHKAARSTCNRSPGRVLVADSRSSPRQRGHRWPRHRGLLPPLPYTPPFPPRPSSSRLTSKQLLC